MVVLQWKISHELIQYKVRKSYAEQADLNLDFSNAFSLESPKSSQVLQWPRKSKLGSQPETENRQKNKRSQVKSEHWVEGIT